MIRHTILALAMTIDRRFIPCPDVMSTPVEVGLRGQVHTIQNEIIIITD